MDLNEVKNLLVIFTNGIKIKKYKLDKENSKVKYKVYTTYPTINTDYNIEDIKNKICKQLLEYFDVLINTLPSNYLNTLFKNLSNIEYQEGLDKKEMLHSIWGIINGWGITEGYYYGYENKVYAVSQKQKSLLAFLSRNPYTPYDDIIRNVLSHEIFHVATYSTDDYITYCGFYQNRRAYDIGNGIDEGYTELLARRYFKKDEGYYDDEVFMASLIEEIIGKNKMEHLYFFADLKGLIKELTKYTNKNLVNRFIINFDTYCQKPNGQTLNELFNFIMEAHKNKILQDDKISNKEVIIKEYNDSLISRIKPDKKTRKH